MNNEIFNQYDFEEEIEITLKDLKREILKFHYGGIWSEGSSSLPKKEFQKDESSRKLIISKLKDNYGKVSIMAFSMKLKPVSSTSGTLSSDCGITVKDKSDK